jgi:hypothetical protein
MRFCLALIGVVALLCSTASGSILSDLVTFDGVADSINDNSRAVIFADNNDTNKPLGIGDEIVGILQFEKVNDTDPSPAGLYAVFSFEVTGTHTYGSSTILECGPVGANETNSLASLLDSSLQPAGFNGWDNAIFAMVEVPTLANNGANDPFSLMHSDPGDDPIAIIQNVITAGNGYSLDAIVGFGQNDDFLSTKLNGDLGIEIGNIDGTATIQEIMDDDAGAFVMSERAGLSVLYDTLGASYLPLSVANWTLPANVTQHDITITPDGSVQTSTDGAPNWHLEDDTNFKMNPVPEPGAMALLLTLLGGFGMIRRHR